jgi:hypothetical protein
MQVTFWVPVEGQIMIDMTEYKHLAASLREQCKEEAAAAIETLLEGYNSASKAAHETRQEIVKQRSQIASLEGQLEMINGIRYQEMRLQLPEGGHVTLRWPASMASESADMLREMVDLQMKHHIAARTKDSK